MLRQGFAEVGFSELNEYELTSGRLSSYNGNDGWHYFGTQVLPHFPLLFASFPLHFSLLYLKLYHPPFPLYIYHPHIQTSTRPYIISFVTTRTLTHRNKWCQWCSSIWYATIVDWAILIFDWAIRMWGPRLDSVCVENQPPHLGSLNRCPTDEGHRDYKPPHTWSYITSTALVVIQYICSIIKYFEVHGSKYYMSLRCFKNILREVKYQQRWLSILTYLDL